jgi:uncharacterized phage protein (TIGR02216 family)
MKHDPFPWSQALAIGLGVLRLSPEQFWRMTPREFAAALRGLYGDPAPPFDRAVLDALVKRFPDTNESSFRGASEASEPGIHEHGARNPDSVFMDSGSRRFAARPE